MVPNVQALLVVIALVLTLVNGLTNPAKAPLWIAVLFLCIALLVGVVIRP